MSERRRRRRYKRSSKKGESWIVAMSFLVLASIGISWIMSLAYPSIERAMDTTASTDGASEPSVVRGQTPGSPVVIIVPNAWSDAGDKAAP